jgi:hypothetical protein
MTPEEWLLLVTLLQKQGPVCVAREDRRFLAQMVNQLTIDDPPPVQPWQQKWIQAIRKECRL